jgi:D-sedoheptulose 7-phosphate isomerase
MSTKSDLLLIEKSLESSSKVICPLNGSKLLEMSRIISDCLKRGHKVMFCGNGGSASQAQHLAAELVCKFRTERKALRAISLTTDTSILTAQSNDYSFETVFSRQVEAHGRKGDVLVGLSTSGSSPNMIEAFKAARKIGITTIALTGNNKGCKLAKIADEALLVDSSDTARIQEAHLVAGHIICELVEKRLS